MPASITESFNALKLIETTLKLFVSIPLCNIKKKIVEGSKRNKLDKCPNWITITRVISNYLVCIASVCTSVDFRFN